MAPSHKIGGLPLQLHNVEGSVTTPSAHQTVRHGKNLTGRGATFTLRMRDYGLEYRVHR